MTEVLIVMPAYCTTEDDLNWIFDAVKSVQLQTFKDWKLSIVDSTPGFLDYPSTVEKKLEPIIGRFLSKERSASKIYYLGGFKRKIPGDVANKVEIGSIGFPSKYIVIMSHDDLIHPQFLEKQLALFDDEVGFTQPNVRLFGSKEAIWNIKPNQTVLDQLSQNQFAGTCLMRRDLFDAFGGYDSDMCPPDGWVGLEDFFLFVKFLAYGWKYKVVEGEPLLFARQRENQASAKFYGSEDYGNILIRICSKMGFEATKTGDQIVFGRTWTTTNPSIPKNTAP